MKFIHTRTIAGYLFLLFFLIISFGIQKKIFTEFDRQSIIFLQKEIPFFLDTPFSFFSILGSFEITTIILIVLLYGVKKLNTIFTFGIYGLGLVIELLAKNILMHPGPTEQFHRYEFDFSLPTSMYQTGNSFPSGHALRSSFLITILLLITFRAKHLSKNKKILFSLFLSVILAIMLVSRISLGEHWFSDVVAGVSLGVGLALLSFY
jgi:membrane-associated phospholipid phosphatase